LEPFHSVGRLGAFPSGRLAMIQLSHHDTPLFLTVAIYI